MKHLLSLTVAAALGASTFAPAAGGTLRSDPYRFALPRERPSGTLYAPTRNLMRLGARYLGTASIPRITINVATPLRNEAGLRAYARAANTPASLYYRHWLTPSQIGETFGTPGASYAATVAHFTSGGMSVSTWPARNMITVSGTGSQLERALGTTFGRFSLRLRGSRRSITFNAPIGEPAYALAKNAAFSHLIGLEVQRTHFMTTSPPEPITSGFSNARVNGATPAQLARAYDYTGAYEAGYTGKGINIGIVGTGPISLDDVPNMRNIYKVPGSSTVTLIPGTAAGDAPPPAVTGPCGASTLGGVSPIGDPTSGSSTSPTTGCDPEDVEAQLDTEQTALLAYDANVRFYLAYNPNGCFVEANPVLGGCIGPAQTSQGLFLTEDEIETAITDNKSDVLSLSYGGCEVLDTATMSLQANPGSDATGIDPTQFEMLAAEGVAVFVSSGDSGSAGCQRSLGNSDAANVSYPASDPNVVAVGGTTTPMGPDGRLTGPITTWGQQTGSEGAEGAGVSVDFLTPPYQQGVLAACTMRCVPDVVLDADPFSGAAVVFNTGLSGGAMEEPVGGTSQAAPDMAAMWALVLSACKVTPSCTNPGNNVVDPAGTAPASPAYRLGNPNFLWYKLAAASQAATFHNTFYDIVYGNDAVPFYANQVAASESGAASAYAAGTAPGSVNAGPGFDEATGLGAPFGKALIKYVVNPGNV